MNKEELEARQLCAKCNNAKGCSDCVPNNKCKEWTMYLDNPNNRLGKILCYIGVHDWYKYRSSNIRRCKRCGKVIDRKEFKWDFETMMYYRNLWLRNVK